MKITFVCTGNTCRSPMLAAMFADYAAKVGFDCEVACAGMKGGGSPVNPKAARTLAARGLSAEGHLSSVFGERNADSDFVFTMTDEQRDEPASRHPSPREESPPLFLAGPVVDPYAGDPPPHHAAADAFEGILGKLHDHVCGRG